MWDSTAYMEVTVVNATDEVLAIGVADSDSDLQLDLNTQGTEMFSPGEGKCWDVSYTGRTDDGLVFAEFGPPVCNGDVWTITQADLDRARTQND